ncbi:MAG: dienelactone hydrolase family protein [Acidimicrobiales bacterium]|nr:dienelactone hydrolase family protein [Acidimicrobiales bacterium]
MADDLLSHYERTTFSDGGKARDVYRRGSGPAVIVIAEMPGISRRVIEFADRVVAIGCTAVLPHLFGPPGFDLETMSAAGRARVMASTLGPVCVSREFSMLAIGKTSPVIDWLRALAVAEHERCGGPGVGAIGMCFTGGFALAMATDERLLAPVLSQPSLPVALSKRHRRSIDISPSDLAKVKQRCAADGLQVLGLRFKGDKLSPGDRFDFLREELGDAFIAVELDDSSARPGAVMPNPHSVVTEHLIDEPGEPTRAALDQVLDLFRTRLLSI